MSFSSFSRLSTVDLRSWTCFWSALTDKGQESLMRSKVFSSWGEDLGLPKLEAARNDYFSFELSCNGEISTLGDWGYYIGWS